MGPTERGAGLLSTTFGLAFFLIFLLAAVQLVHGLYATSVVTDAAYAAGRHVAGRAADDGRSLAEAEAHARFRAAVGDHAATLSFAYEGDDVVVRVRGAHPTFVPDAFAQALPLTSIDRTLRIRIEELR